MTTKTRTVTVLIIMIVTNRLIYRIINDNDQTNRGTKHYYNDGSNVDTVTRLKVRRYRS